MDYSQGSTMLYRSTPATHARFHAGGISFRFLGSSALSIARLAAVIAPSLLSDVPDFVPVPVSTDHFQRPRWIPWIIRYSTPRCSMLSLPPRRAWSILLGWVRLCWRLPSGRLTSSNEGMWVLVHHNSSAAPQTVQTASPVCGTKNFSSVRLYSAPQLHRTIVAILGICPCGTPDQPQCLCPKLSVITSLRRGPR